MSDAVDQMRPTALEEFQRHQGGKWGQKEEKEKKEECLCVENFVFKAPIIIIFYINNGPNEYI